MLAFDVPVDSTYRLLYSGPVGVAGVNVQQSWDIRKLPKYVRRIPSFKDDFRVFVRQVDDGVSSVSKFIDFGVGSDGVPISMILTLTAAAPTDRVDIEAWFLHSVVR